MTIYQATGLTIEYDTVRGVDALVIARFPSTDPDDRLLITGSLEDLRGVVDSMSSLLDDLAE